MKRDTRMGWPLSILFTLALLNTSVWAGIRVIVDSPKQWVAELETSQPRIIATPNGNSVSMPGFSASGHPGTPDIPVWNFQVITRNGNPQSHIEILETELFDGSDRQKSIAPVLEWITPSRSQSQRDLAAYSQYQVQAIRWEPLGRLRGIPISSGAFHLVWLDGEGKPVGWIRKARITLNWNETGSSPTALSQIITGQVLNPKGGTFLAGAKPGLSRRAASPINPQGIAPTAVSSHLVRIQIGDREIDRMDEDGFYALPFETFSAIEKQNAGINIDQIRMYTGTNDTITSRMDTVLNNRNFLREIPIEVIDGNGSRTFDAGDTLKFYAHGTSVWKPIAGASGPIRYQYGNDPYSFENIYFVDVATKSQPGLRLKVLSPQPASQIQTQTLAYVRAERDLGTAFCDPSGKLDKEPGYAWHWFWRGKCGQWSDEPISWSKQELIRPHLNELVGYAGDSVYFGFFNFRGSGDNNFDLYVRGSDDTLAYRNGLSSSGSWYVSDGSLQDSLYPLEKVLWKGRDRRFEGYTIAYPRKLAFDGRPIFIFPEVREKRQGYRISGSSSYRVLKIQDGVGKEFLPIFDDGTFTDSAGADENIQYLVFHSDNSLSKQALSTMDGGGPEGVLKNLATADGTQPEYIIITPDVLLSSALEYREYRASKQRAIPVQASVVRISDIQRDFSGGRVNPVAVRDFLRFALNEWGAGKRESNPLKFVLLFGDGHFNVRRLSYSEFSDPPPNLIPPFENFDNSDDAICSDDFFVKLDAEDQGIWGISGSNELLDLALGRIPVRNLEEANQYLNKVKAYEDPKNAGDWRSRIILTADDHIQMGAGNPVDNLDPILGGHTNDTELLGQMIRKQELGVLLDKVYLLDYSMNASFRKPEAAQDLISLMNRGAVAVNYVGHGAFNQWADEVLLYTTDALPRLHNFGRTTMLNSFSCTVGRFDNLQNDVLTEQFVRQGEVGAIAGISATRESYPGPNLQLANAVYRRLFPVDTSNTVNSMGVALQQAKNSSETSNDVNDSKYSLLGDPALLIRRPKLHVKLNAYPDTLRALDCGKIKGEVKGGSGNGFVRILMLSGSVHKDYRLPPGMTDQYQDKRGSILYERTTPFKNHQFEADYFIPKKISYGDSTAEILVYAWDGEREAEGSTGIGRLSIAGTATNSPCAVDSDQKGPRIRISGCDATETGGVDFPNSIRLNLPYCLNIQVEDSTGGVVSGEGPDEGTTVEIPGVIEPFHPQPGLENLFQKNYRYSLGKSDLKPGNYLLKVSAHDGYGNGSQRQLELQIVRDTAATALAAYNIPNPMKRSGTTFYFASLMPADDGEYLPVEGTVRIQYQLKIFNQIGRVVKVLNSASAQGTFWDGRDAFGNRLANGVYYYVVKASYDPGDGTGKRFTSSKRNALVISR